MRGGFAGRMRRLVLSRIRVVMLSVGALAAVLVVASHLIDEGEIVKLTSIDSKGRDHVTELWIVDLGDATYLRAGSPEAEWLARVRGNPEVSVSRGESDGKYHAIPETDPGTREKVNHAMSEKYGFADLLWEHLSDRDGSVPIRLSSLRDAATVAP